MFSVLHSPMYPPSLTLNLTVTPCRLEAAITATEDTVDLAIVDIDDLGDLAMEFDVSAVPTVLGVKDGKVFILCLKKLKIHNMCKKKYLR